MYDVDKNAANIANYTFNALGNRVKKYVNSGSLTTKMLYDGADCVADYNNDLELQRYYITPMLDENLLQHQASDSADYYYTHDGLGTVRDLINTSQTTENSYDFYAYGTSKTSTENITNRFKFTGRELDTETSSANSTALYYYRAKTYDSEIGSFTSRDPIGEIDSNNLYSYVNNNPICNVDPLGLFIFIDVKYDSEYYETSAHAFLKLKKAILERYGFELITDYNCKLGKIYITTSTDIAKVSDTVRNETDPWWRQLLTSLITTKFHTEVFMKSGDNRLWKHANKITEKPLDECNFVLKEGENLAGVINKNAGRFVRTWEDTIRQGNTGYNGTPKKDYNKIKRDNDEIRKSEKIWNDIKEDIGLSLVFGGTFRAVSSLKEIYKLSKIYKRQEIARELISKTPKGMKDALRLVAKKAGNEKANWVYRKVLVKCKTTGRLKEFHYFETTIQGKTIYHAKDAGRFTEWKSKAANKALKGG